jgi:hypothetical protein
MASSDTLQSDGNPRQRQIYIDPQNEHTQSALRQGGALTRTSYASKFAQATESRTGTATPCTLCSDAAPSHA